MLGAEAIDTFFRGATTPGLWPSALETIARDLKSDGATLVDGPSYRSRVSTSTHIASFVEEYFSLEARHFDSRESRVNPTTDDTFVSDLDTFTAEEIDRDPYYVEFLRPRGFGWHAVACLRGGESPLVLSLKRRLNQGPFQRAELARMAKVLPYLRAGAQAAQMALSFRSQDHLEALRSEGQGGVLLNQDGRVLAINATVELGDGLSIVDGRLRAAYPAEQGALDRSISIAVSQAPPHELPIPTPAVLHRPSGRRPLIVRVARLFDAAPNPMALARAVAGILDTDVQPVPAASLLRDMFGLTPKEAELAMLLGAGRTLNNAADLCHISLSHARQRLKVVFQKTETSRQSELVSLLLRLA